MTIELATDQIIESTTEKIKRDVEIATRMIDQFLSIYGKDGSLITDKAIKELGQQIIGEQNN